MKFILVFLSGFSIYAQKPHNHTNDIGLSLASVQFLGEKETAFGAHLHYIKTLKNHPKFGIGIGLEQVFDEHSHSTIGVVGSYRPINRLNLNISPGASFEKNQFKSPIFACHIEGSYEFNIGETHIGPSIEFAFDQEDLHIGIGLHIGLGF